MKLVELWNKPVKWEWTTLKQDHAIAEFEVGDRQFEFTGSKRRPETIDDLNTWEVLFYDIRGGFALTGAGNSVTVMSTIIDILREFIEFYDPEQIIFSAHEPSRQKLYQRIVRQLLPTWHVNTGPDGSEFFVSKPHP